MFKRQITIISDIFERLIGQCYKKKTQVEVTSEICMQIRLNDEYDVKTTYFTM